MPSFSIVTFGCQMNQHDSERIGEVLRAAGYGACEDPDRADLILLNTCSVREKAEHKLRSEVGRLGLLKRARPELVIGVAGCVAQQEGERLVKKLPQIDLVIGPDNIEELPALLAEIEGGAPPLVRTEFDVEAPRFLAARPEPGHAPASAFVTVMKGCDERCSFCIVPRTRGPERYRASGEIVAEIARWVDAGAAEVTLLGQTVNSYRDPSGALPQAPEAGAGGWAYTRFERAAEDESEFAALLRAIAGRVPGLRRMRYTSPHPRHLTRSLIAAHRDLVVLARHVHLPVQSGSDAVLRRMIRRYSVDEYRERVDALRAAVPGVTLSTDVIVGFPGETREDFEKTLELVRERNFMGVFGFKYSPRPFTPALKLGDDVPEAEKSARLSALFAVSEALKREHLRARVGEIERVLVEGRSKGEKFTGRSGRNEIVHFAARRNPTESLVDVRIVEAFNNSLSGEPVDPTLRADAPPVRHERRALPVV